MPGPWEEYSPPSSGPWSAYRGALPRGKFGAAIEAAALAADPGLRVTGRDRTPARNRQVGGVPNSAHLTGNARDFAPRPGESLAQAQARLEKEFGGKGFKVILEGAGAKHSTGPHLHVEATGGAQDIPPWEQYAATEEKPWERFKAPQSAAASPRPSDPTQPPESAQRPGKPPSRQQTEQSLPEAAWQGIKNIPGAAWEDIKTGASAVRHPIRTAKAIGNVAGNIVRHPIASGESLLKSTVEFGQGGLASGMQTVGLGGILTKEDEDAARKFKQGLVEQPIGSLAALVPGGRIAGKLSKLDKAGAFAREAVAARSISPAERAAARAKMAKDAQAGKAYKDAARPIMARHRLDAERAAAELRKHQKVVGNLPSEEQRKLAMAADTGDRSGIDRKYHPALDAVKKVAKFYDQRIHAIYAKGGYDIPEFMDNYYTHLWKEKPGVVKDRMYSRQGSSRSLKKRTIPTLADGIRAGLTPRYENMLDTMTHYASTMSAHLVNYDLMNAMRAHPEIGAKFVPRFHVPEGMKRLEGIGTEKMFVTRDGKPMQSVLAAQSKAADIYNRRIGKSVLDNPAGRIAKRVSGGVVALKLFSLYHPNLIAGKAVASDLGNGIRHLSRFAPVEAAKSLAHMPFAPVMTFREGAKMGQRLLAGDMNEIDKLFVESGESAGSGGLHPFHSIDRPSFAESALRGTFKADIKRAFDDARKGTAAQRGIGAAKGVARTTLRALDTMNDLVFRYYVPAIKRGAFEREMATSLKAHPEWGEEEKLAEARNIRSSVEGRMGLVTKDNLFWSNTAHDIGRMIFLSPSWQLGNVRIIDDAMKGVPKGQKGFFRGHGISNGKAQAAGLVGSYMLGNAFLTRFYTGKNPQSSQDLFAAPTGGKNKDGSAERVTPPSVIPELYRWFAEPSQEAGNVLNPALKTQWDVLTNRDYANHPIYRPDYASPWPHSRARDIAEYELGGVTPIPLTGNDNDKSNVGALARFVGLRPVGKMIANPEGYAAMRRNIADRESRSTVKRERIEDAKKKKAKR